MRITSKCDMIILPNQVKFVLTNNKTNLDEFEFRICNDLNCKTKLIFKGYIKGDDGTLYIGLMNISDKIEDYKIRKGQLLGFVYE